MLCAKTLAPSLFDYRAGDCVLPDERQQKTLRRAAREERRFVKRCGLEVVRAGNTIQILSVGQVVASLARDDANFLASWIRETCGLCHNQEGVEECTTLETDASY